MGNDEHTSLGMRALGSIRDKFWIRAVILITLALAIVGAFLPSETRSALGLKAAAFVGAYFGLGIVIGGVAGWLTYSKRVWLWTTALISILCLLIGIFYSSHFFEPWVDFKTSDSTPQGPNISASNNSEPISPPKPENSVATANPAPPLARNEQRQNLKGLRSLALAIDTQGFGDWAPRCGMTTLNKEFIAAHVRAILSKSKIEIASSPALAKNGYIHVTVMPSGHIPCGASVDLYVNTDVMIKNNGKKFSAQIWQENGSFDVDSPHEIDVSARTDGLINDYVNIFLDDWNAANK